MPARSTGGERGVNVQRFIKRQVEEIRSTVGNATAINALSGGVDSAVCTVLGHRALGQRLRTVLVDNALMRAGEPQHVVALFRSMGIPVDLIDARAAFLRALRGLTDPEEKRHAVTRTFYRDVFGRLVRKTGARFLIHGTILTDIEETVAGIKRQHNILSQLGLDVEKEFGYGVIEPLKTLRKHGVRQVGAALGLPREITQRPPFPGPGLATRITGEITKEKLELVRAATEIVEKELARTGAFQYFAALLEDRATGIRDDRREFGRMIAVRCIESRDARKARHTRVPWATLERITRQITALPGVNRCLYDLTPKPPATVEYL